MSQCQGNALVLPVFIKHLSLINSPFVPDSLPLWGVPWYKMPKGESPCPWGPGNLPVKKMVATWQLLHSGWPRAWEAGYECVRGAMTHQETICMGDKLQQKFPDREPLGGSICQSGWQLCVPLSLSQETFLPRQEKLQTLKKIHKILTFH